jgi:hypothetical protein
VLEQRRGDRTGDFPLDFGGDHDLFAFGKILEGASEDFNSGGTLEGVHFLNPFNAGFNPASL